MSSQDSVCDRVEKLRLDEAEGRPLEPEDILFIEAHFERCSECSLENRVIEQMAFDETCAPAPQLDDLACRRWVDSVVDQARVDRKPSAVSGVWRKPLVLVAAAAALLLIIGAVTWAGMDNDGGDPALAGITQVAIEGGLLMSFGEVSRENEHLKLGDILKKGDEISVGEGGVVAALGDGIAVYLGADTRAVLRTMNSSNVDLHLLAGSVVANVDPGHAGPGFAVSTGTGRAVVTGTVFSVDVYDDQHLLRVFRGGVTVEDGANRARKVRVGEEAVFGVVGLTRFDRDKEHMVSDVLAAMELLTDGKGSSLEVESVPTGAMVSLDGAVLGRTPLIAHVREGHRRLEMDLDGYDSVRELLELESSGRLTRVFELGQTVAVKGTDPSDEMGTDSAAARRPEANRPASSLSASQLLERAREMRMAHNWVGAVETYKDLCRTYPGSSEARSALVSRGHIELEKLRHPAAALRSFNRYLRGQKSGTLAQEAAFGKAQALRTLGQSTQEKATLQAFVRDFPDAIQIHRVKDRLNQLK